MTLESERMKERLRNEATLMEGDEGAPTFTSDLRWLLDQLEQAEQRERGLREAVEWHFASGHMPIKIARALAAQSEESADA